MAQERRLKKGIKLYQLLIGRENIFRVFGTFRENDHTHIVKNGALGPYLQIFLRTERLLS